jgi:hypothetical protein
LSPRIPLYVCGSVQNSCSTPNDNGNKCWISPRVILQPSETSWIKYHSSTRFAPIQVLHAYRHCNMIMLNDKFRLYSKINILSLLSKRYLTFNKKNSESWFQFCKTCECKILYKWCELLAGIISCIQYVNATRTWLYRMAYQSSDMSFTSETLWSQSLALKRNRSKYSQGEVPLLFVLFTIYTPWINCCMTSHCEIHRIQGYGNPYSYSIRIKY